MTRLPPTQLALTFLGPKGKACFWLELLRRYAALLRYTPGPRPKGSRARGRRRGGQRGQQAEGGDAAPSSYWAPVAEFVGEELAPWLEQHKARSFAFAA